jgi:hypothetical protein
MRTFVLSAEQIRSLKHRQVAQKRGCAMKNEPQTAHA